MPRRLQARPLIAFALLAVIAILVVVVLNDGQSATPRKPPTPSIADFAHDNASPSPSTDSLSPGVRASQNRQRQASAQRAAAAQRRHARYVASPRARRERAESRRRFRDLTANRALKAVESEQPSVVEEPTWNPPSLADGEEISAYLSETSARVSMPGDQPDAIVESTAGPIAVQRDGSLQPIDLTPQPAPGGWRPARGNTFVQMPTDLQDPVIIGSENRMQGIRVRAAASSSRGVVTDGNKVFYANAARDTDAIIEPMPLGAQFAWTLRSPNSPTSLPIDLELPPNARLTTQPDGSMAILVGEVTIATVSNPVAYDAQRSPVDVRLVVDGGRLSVEANHRGANVAYPVVVDPYVNFWGTPSIVTTNPDGNPENASGSWYTWDASASIELAASNAGYLTRRELYTLPGTNAPAGSNAGWAYDPPRESNVFRVEFASASHSTGSPAATLDAGIWVPTYGWGDTAWAGWVNGSSCVEVALGNIPGCQASKVFTATGSLPSSTVVACAALGCGMGGRPNNIVNFVLTKPTGAAISTRDTAAMYGAYIYFSDYSNPQIGLSQSPTTNGWQNVPYVTTTVYGYDPGVGLGNNWGWATPSVTGGPHPAVEVKRNGALVNNGTLPQSGGDAIDGPSCTGVNWSPCPSDWNTPWTDTTEGINNYEFTVYDIVGHASPTQTFTAKIDRTPPTISLGGQLGTFLKSAIVGDKPPRVLSRTTPYKITAVDGNPESTEPSTRRSGTKQINVRITSANPDGSDSQNTVAGTQNSDSTACDGTGTVDSCAGSVTGVVNTTSLAPGYYYIHVNALDQAGNLASQAFKFGVGIGDIVSVTEGLGTARYVPLQADLNRNNVQASVVRFQWREKLTDNWSDLAPTTMRIEKTGAQPAENLFTLDGDGKSERVIVDTSQLTLPAGGRPTDGELNFRGIFDAAGNDPTRSSEDVTLVLDHGGVKTADDTAQVGPGTVDLMTGNFSTSATDFQQSAHLANLAVSRSYNSRYASVNDEKLKPRAVSPLGPGWEVNLPAGSSEFTGLVDHGDISREELDQSPYVEALVEGGDVVVFELAPPNPDDPNAPDIYIPQVGAERLRLERDAASDYSTIRFRLTDLDSGKITLMETRDAVKNDGTYFTTSVTMPSSTKEITYEYQTVNTRQGDKQWPKRAVAPIVESAPSGTFECNSSETPKQRGCQWLAFAYSDVQVDPANSAVTDKRLTSVTLHTWDPDLNSGTGGMTDVEVARYEYDSSGRLSGAWDPRVEPSLKTVYAYDANNLLVSVTPPGELPHTIAYASTQDDLTAGRAESISRNTPGGSTATTSLRYGVPLSGDDAPANMTISEVSKWAQAVPPLSGTAVFPPDQLPNGAIPDNWSMASISYLDPLGREVNAYEPGGRINATEYDGRGNVVRTLTAANRELALTQVESPEDLTSQVASKLYDTQVSFEESDPVAGVTSWHMVEQRGPQHLARLGGSPDLVAVRSVTRLEYDENAPADGSGPDAPAGPYDLPTTTTTGAQTATGLPLSDVRVKKTEYDWKHRKPTAQINDMGTSDTSDDIVRRVVYDQQTGLEIERRQPEDSNTSSVPTTTRTIYYAAGANSGDADCGNKPEWVDLVCKVTPGAQPTTAGLPDLPVKQVTLYNRFRQPLTTMETVTRGGATSTRASATTYDPASRPLTEEVAASSDDPGTAIHPLPKVRHVYSSTTGRNIRTETLNGDGTVAKTITRNYDSIGRMTSYVDANGNASYTSYDLLSRPVQTSDGKGTQTRTYDAITGNLSTLVDTQIGTTNASYDADGRVITETLPNGLVKSYVYNTTGDVITVSYYKSTNCSENCIWYSNSVERSGQSQVVSDEDTFSDREYEYDYAGRLTRAEATRNAQCTTRAYRYDRNSNRTSHSHETSSDAACSQEPGNTRTPSYDADRLIDDGYEYDSFGRITKVPQQDAGGESDMSASYYVNDRVRSIAQDGVSQTLTLDPVNRATRKDVSEYGKTASEDYAFDGDSDSPSWVKTTVTATKYNKPTDLSGSGNGGVTQVATGSNHTCLLINGGVSCFGSNNYGQLGDSTKNDRETPSPVVGLSTGVAEIAAGVEHTCARLVEGSIKCWGSNSAGRLGDGTTITRTTPVLVSGISTGATDLSVGATHTCAVVSGAAKCWGSNANGRLGNNSTTNSSIPVQVVGLDAGVKQVDAGALSTCAVMQSNGAVCWGNGSYGQLGNGTTTSTQRTPVQVQDPVQGGAIVDVAVGNGHACAITINGAASCWGNNASGQLGDGTSMRSLTPVQVATLDAGVTKVSAGGSNSCAVVNQAVKCWGSNSAGQLGNDSASGSIVPIQPDGLENNWTGVSVGPAHICSTSTEGKSRCAGSNSYGKIAPVTTTTTTRYVASISGDLAATYSSIGYSSTGKIRYQIVNVRGDVVAEADNIGLQQVGPIDEFGVPEDGTLPQGRRYGFQGSHQREALTESGTVAMGVRLYVPRIGRFLQVDPVLGGTEGAYEYPSDPVNSSDLDGRRSKRRKHVVEVLQQLVFSASGLPMANIYTTVTWYTRGRGQKARIVGHTRVKNRVGYFDYESAFTDVPKFRISFDKARISCVARSRGCIQSDISQRLNVKRLAGLLSSTSHMTNYYSVGSQNGFQARESDTTDLTDILSLGSASVSVIQ